MTTILITGATGNIGRKQDLLRFCQALARTMLAEMPEGTAHSRVLAGTLPALLRDWDAEARSFAARRAPYLLYP